MTDSPDFRVSGQSLFPAIEAMLAEGQSVKFTVTGNSMWPLISHNRDSVLLTPKGDRRMKKGDIILFRTGSGDYVLHRITKVLEGGYITTGDGNRHRDGLVPEDTVRAKVSVVYRKEMTIDCGKWYWKMGFRVWMAAFPIRGFLMKTVQMMLKCRRPGRA